MPAFSMTGVKAVMAQASVNVTVGGSVFTMAAGVPFTTSHSSIDVPATTKLAVMDNPKGVAGPAGMVQVFSIDRIVTISAVEDPQNGSDSSNVSARTQAERVAAD